MQLAKDRLNAYYEAELAILSGQEYKIGSRTLRRADLKEVRAAINALERQVQELEALQNGNTTARARRVIIRDI
ncbi:MAG: hypothetical protein H0Z40_01435 [Desulfotomaculum sp.]|nr:hypothetical protein [Desulfotomaculum sp.]